MGMLGLLPVLLSFGAIDALVPLLIVIILIGAAAAMTRGWDVFKILGINFVADIGAAGVGSKGGLSRAVKTTAGKGSKGGMMQKPSKSYYNRAYLVISKKVVAPLVGRGATSGKNLLYQTKQGKRFLDWMGRDKEKIALTTALTSYANKGWGAPPTAAGRVKMAVMYNAGSVIRGRFGNQLKYKTYQKLLKNQSLSAETREGIQKSSDKLAKKLGVSGPTSAVELATVAAGFEVERKKIVENTAAQLKKQVGSGTMSEDFKRIELAETLREKLDPLVRQRELMKQVDELKASSAGGPVSRSDIEKLVNKYRTAAVYGNSNQYVSSAVSEVEKAVAGARTAPQTNVEKITTMLELNDLSKWELAKMGGLIAVTGGTAALGIAGNILTRRRKRKEMAEYTKTKAPSIQQL
jgi:hypothetical protein